MKNIFTVLLIIGCISFITNLIFKLVYWYKNKEKREDVFDVVVMSLFNKLSIVSFIGSMVLYILFSLTPYLMNEKDSYLIESHKKNISLYEEYITDYQSAAQKQIQEYQRMQSEMARTATAIQLQYFSQQIDAVGSAITEKIKEFNDLIMRQRIEINLATARMNIRKLNKFYF